MARLEELTRGAQVKGILPDGLVTVVDVQWHGAVALELTYKDAAGRLGHELLFRDREPTLEVLAAGRLWNFDADGHLLRLVSEAYRIRLAYLFDPRLAVHTSLVEPLPHQITAVYGEMLARQPLRFLLADDPGAGKTIMAGLFIKELLIRGDLHRCLIVCPGSLVEQWQDELNQRFHLPFEMLTNDKLESARTGNWFAENNLAIARLDKLSRDETVQAKLEQTDWDLIVCDEAHKLSATFFGGEVKYTKRYRLGQLLSKLTRHFLLLTATPHNGKEEDFQLFLALLDEDRFEGRFRSGVHKVDVTDLMRHLVKEQLYTFEGKPLFPERLASSVNYALSPLEDELYKEVTNYVQREFNRADALSSGQRGTVGFALTTLQRRLASSPGAIYQSLRRRRERLERRLLEEQQQRQGTAQANDPSAPLHEPWRQLPLLSEDDLDDLDDAPDAELEKAEELVVDQASASRTIAELRIEIELLTRLEALALRVRRSETDSKWEGLASLLQTNDVMFDTHGSRRKLVIFTEHRDTLNYLVDRIRTLLGQVEAVVTIHGGMGREERLRTQEAFTQDPAVQVLVATDAAGEGINLQRAHLMVNYDLPWNPNRLEQRFGRIHRIGQTEVCHLWNLVALQTREGEVFRTLLDKLAEERDALGGQVFDVLGKVQFENRPLRDLIVEAIRYGDRADVRARLTRVVGEALDRQHLQALLEERALTHEVMDVVRVRQVREEMERATARRLQPHFIASFFLEALRMLGGKYYEREPRRYEITHVPGNIRNALPAQHGRATVGRRYERIVFEKELVNVPGKPLATLVFPGQPLLDAIIELILTQHRDLLKQGALLLDPNDAGEESRVLFYLEHTIQDASTDTTGKRREVSRQLQFVETSATGELYPAGYAPFLDYRPLTDDERELLRGRGVEEQLRQQWQAQGDLEARARSYAITQLVPRHLAEVRQRREEQIDRTVAAVNERLTKEISYWDSRAAQLQEQEKEGKINARLNSTQARKRAEELEGLRERRLHELEQERHLSPLPPVVAGGVLVVPAGLLAKLMGQQPDRYAHETAAIERAAMEAVMAHERSLGYEPRDVSRDKCGYDIESRIPGTGRLRFIEVKGRVAGATTVTVTRNEILTALNKPDDFILAIVEVDGATTRTQYVTRPFQREPDFGAESVNYTIREWFP